MEGTTGSQGRLQQKEPERPTEGYHIKDHRRDCRDPWKRLQSPMEGYCGRDHRDWQKVTTEGTPTKDYHRWDHGDAWKVTTERTVEGTMETRGRLQ